MKGLTTFLLFVMIFVSLEKKVTRFVVTHMCWPHNSHRTLRVHTNRGEEYL